MKHNFLLLIGVWICACAPTQENSVRVNSLGFLPKQEKQATITEDARSFSVRDAQTNKAVFTAQTAGPFFQEDVNQSVWIADFSAFSENGEYYIELPKGSRSTVFKINDNVYHEPFKTAMRAFYLWRCGTDIHGEYGGNVFSFPACHLDDAYEDYVGNPGVRRDGTGGWHDAGDYGKYIVNAGITMGMLFMAWDCFQPEIEKIPLGLPETAPGFPDFLKELKWEMDWVLKMQYPDGSGRVSHKLTRTNFAPFIMPDEDNEKRYFTEWSSAATASFAAMTAQAARVFAPYDKEYADTCLQAARLSYECLKNHPEEKPFVQGDFQTGGYQTDDEDDKLWAAAEMWNTTGEQPFLHDFEQRAAAMNFRVDENWDWGNVSNLGAFTYLLSSRSGKNAEIESALRKNAVEIADEIVSKSKQDVYRRPFERYYWGCNGTVARLTMNLFVANRLNADARYKNAAGAIIDHLFGRNYYNRSFVTGLGIRPPMHPHDRRSGADDIAAPWPGYLVGGGHSATDWVDEEESYSHNEVAINWQAPLVFALGWMLE